MGYNRRLQPLHLLGDFLGVLNTSLTIVLVFVHKKDIVEPASKSTIAVVELFAQSRMLITMCRCSATALEAAEEQGL